MQTYKIILNGIHKETIQAISPMAALERAVRDNSHTEDLAYSRADSIRIEKATVMPLPDYFKTNPVTNFKPSNTSIKKPLIKILRELANDVRTLATKSVINHDEITKLKAQVFAIQTAKEDA